MFKVKVIKNCPVSRASQGVIRFKKEHIAMIAGAAKDSKIEWLAFLNGKRSKDGFEVTVDELTVPQQYRGSAHATIPEQEIAANVVGVIHLHPWWSQANFSGIDDSTLNPRFPSSIVVSPSYNGLGFTYEAEGKVKLPCGEIGRAPFYVDVVGAPERFRTEPVKATHKGFGPDTNMGDCNQYSVEEDELDQKVLTACGIKMLTERPAVFGLAGDGLLSVVKEMTLAQPKSLFKGKDKSTDRGNGGVIGFRNGLQRLYGPGGKHDTGLSALDISKIDRGGKYTTKGGCDECEVRGEMLRFHTVMDAWYCRDCYADAEALIARALRDGRDRTEYEDLVKRDGEGAEVKQLGDGSLVTL